MLNLYNKEIVNTQSLFSQNAGSVPVAAPQNAWPVLKNEDLILKSDMSMDLGGGEAFGISGILFTTEEKLVSENKVIVSGPSLLELEQNQPAEINYARFVVIRLKSEAIENKTTQQLYAIFRKLDYVRYHIFPNGFALRISTVQHREAVRISKTAVENKISFERVGQAFVNAYMALPEVDAVQIYFMTSLKKSDVFKQLDLISKKSNEITESLNEIFNGLKMDCSVCAQKTLCDEIEGLRDLHSKLNM